MFFDRIQYKIEAGEKLTSEEIFGNPALGISGLKSFVLFVVFWI